MGLVPTFNKQGIAFNPDITSGSPTQVTTRFIEQSGLHGSSAGPKPKVKCKAVKHHRSS